MDGAWLARMRWRRRGAWLWPMFAAALVADALIGHALPPAGESQTPLAASLVGAVLSLIAMVLLRAPLGALIKRRRQDLPRIVARDYAGTAAIALVTVALLVAGLAHRPTIVAHRNAMNDAIKRAQAYIGDRAPAEFRRNLQVVSLLAIQAGTIYRACVPNVQDTKTYCVIVDRSKPLAQSVRFSGYEPNATLASGTD
jgi:hypothetical protein